VDAWFRLPSADWAANLVNLALAVVSASAAIYASAVLAWIAQLEAATRATSDEDGRRLEWSLGEARHARLALQEVQGRDPQRTLGRLSLALATPMTAIGVIAGLQVPDSGLVYTVVPVLIAAAVAIGSAFLPGRAARREAARALADLKPPRGPARPTP
jgi:hypothetical protein